MALDDKERIMGGIVEEVQLDSDGYIEWVLIQKGEKSLVLYALTFGRMAISESWSGDEKDGKSYICELCGKTVTNEIGKFYKPVKGGDHKLSCRECFNKP